jgi:hypothetical protein
MLPIEALSIKQDDDAMFVYMDARSFGTVEDEYTRTSALHWFQTYETPWRKDLVGKWLMFATKRLGNG